MRRLNSGRAIMSELAGGKATELTKSRMKELRR